MSVESIVTFVVLGILLVLSISQFMSVRKKERENNKKEEEKRRSVGEIISNIIDLLPDFIDSSEKVRNGLKKGLGFKWEAHASTLIMKVRECLEMPFRKNYKCSEYPILVLQNFFDQTLKFYAMKLHEIYRLEEEFRNVYHVKELKLGSLEKEEIEKLLSEKQKIENRKKDSKQKFWNLYNSIKYLRFDVLGEDDQDKSYKVYLLLKTSYNF